MHIAKRFERFLEEYPREDGSRWGGQDLEKATGGVVTRSYVSTLCKGRIENPGYEKMRAIAKAMGFPPELWFADDLVASEGPAPETGSSLAGRVERLFESVENPKTGKPYTNAEAARASAGDLTEEDVEGIRSGAISDPTVGKAAALARVFGVEPSYLLDRAELPSLDGEMIRALRDETVGEIVRRSARLPERERRLVLGIVRQFDDE